jgi:hypothetical protein
MRVYICRARIKDRHSPLHPQTSLYPPKDSMPSSENTVPYCSAFSGNRPPSRSYAADERHHSEHWRPCDFGDATTKQRSSIAQASSASRRLPAYAPDSASSRREFDNRSYLRKPSTSQAEDAKTERTSAFSFLPAPKGMEMHPLLDVTLDILDDQTREQRRRDGANRIARTAQWAADASSMNPFSSGPGTQRITRRI